MYRIYFTYIQVVLLEEITDDYVIYILWALKLLTSVSSQHVLYYAFGRITVMCLHVRVTVVEHRHSQ